MRIFDIHIGLSDASLQLNKDPEIESSFSGEFPNQFDFVRAGKGNLDFFSGMICPIAISGSRITLPENQKQEILKHIKFFEEQQNKGNLTIIKKTTDFDSEKIKVVLGLEGVYFVKNKSDLEFVTELISSGIKIIGFKWNFKSKLFSSKNKISQLGKEFLKVCEDNGIILDLAHSEGDLIAELLSNFKGKVIDSHTCMGSISANNRNIKDEFVAEIIRRSGLVGINFVGEFVGGNNMDQLAKHFQYFADRFGVDNLCIGSDFDGMERSDLIEGLEDVSKYESLVQALISVGFREIDVQKIMFENARNFFLENIK